MRALAIRTSLSGALALSALALAPAVFRGSAHAQGKFFVRPLSELKVAHLPPGPLYWRIDNFRTLSAARAVAGPTGLVAEAAGKVWLFTLGPRNAHPRGGSLVAEIGPVPVAAAPQYLLRINRAGGPPGAKTKIHAHPGAETFYVLAGRMTQRTPSGEMQVGPGAGAPGHAADTAMQVSSSGKSDLDQFVMFVVDATRPFSSPATLK